MDPVVSSLAGDGFPPLLIFRKLNTRHTRIATQMALRAIRPLELNQGTAKRCRIAKMTSRDSAGQVRPTNGSGNNPTAVALNELLGARVTARSPQRESLMAPKREQKSALCAYPEIASRSILGS
jgi:hypothetical protein